jgi:hypothetical protein
MPPASRAALLLLFLSAPTWPQAPKASIHGVVRDATTGAPIADAEVRASNGSGVAVEATTDSLGQFNMGGLEAGEAKIRVFHFFLGGDVTKVVNLTEGPNPKPVEILLRTGGHISGRVTDQDGKPLAGIFVRALRRLYSTGKLQYAYAGGDDSTRSDGQYYIDGLPAGRGYIIMAQRDQGADVKPVSDEPEDPASRKDIPAPTYFPNADSPDRAIPVQLDSNDTRDHIDIRLLRSPSYCVEGAADLPSLGVGAEDALRLGLSDRPPSVGMTGGTLLGPDGKFRICDLYPGEYSLSLSVQRGRMVARAAPVLVIDRDVDRVTFTPEARSATLIGRVVWEGDPLKLAQGGGFLTLEMPGPAPGTHFSPGIPISGEFSIELSPSLMPSRVEDVAIRVTGLPPGAYVKNLLQSGASVLITLASDGARITAQAADKDGNPVPEAYIAAFPASPESESALAASLRSGKTNSRGAWTSAFLPPGRYSVLATGTPIETSTDNISFETIQNLWLARGQAQTVDLAAGSTAVATLVPTPLR